MSAADILRDWSEGAPFEELIDAADVIDALCDAMDPTNVRKAASLLKDVGHGLHAGLLILMADAQDRALAKARGSHD